MAGRPPWPGHVPHDLCRRDELGRLRVRDRAEHGLQGRSVTSDSFVELARRPMNSRLCNDRLSDVHGVVLARWQDALSEVWTRYGDVGR